MSSKFASVLAAMHAYLRREVSGSELVQAINNFVSSDAVYDMDDATQRQILELQDTFAFYVQDQVKRREHPSYIGEPELEKIIRAFVAKVH